MILPRIAFFLFVVLFVNNCGGLQTRSTESQDVPGLVTVPEQKKKPQLRPDYAEDETDTRLVQPLLVQSEHYEQGGNYESAAAMLERALQVTPRNAEVWHRLARVRLKQGRLNLAAQFAHKSNSLLRGNFVLEKENEKIFRAIADRKREMTN